MNKVPWVRDRNPTKCGEYICLFETAVRRRGKWVSDFYVTTETWNGKSWLHFNGNDVVVGWCYFDRERGI